MKLEGTEQIAKSVSQFLHRFHVILFVLLVVGGLATATFLLFEIVNNNTPPEPIPSTSSFDQETIDKIRGLRTPSDGRTDLELPNGRTNPFS